MDVPFWVWAVTVGVIVAALVFGLLIWWRWGAGFAGEYFAGYVTEKSLSVDNLFVFVLIMASFGVPRELQQNVLLFGITFALVLRTVFIAVGAAAIENFSWVFYLFGAILIYTAWVQARSGGHSGDEDYKENAVLRLT